MHARRRACMQDACLAGLLLVLGACAAAAAAELSGDQKSLQAAADSQHAARHLMQANAGCPGPNCQTGSAGNAGGGPGGGGAGVASLGARPGPVMTPTMPTPSAASASPAAAGATALPGLSPDVTSLRYFQQGIVNWRELKSWGFKGWDFASNPCQGWSGVSCDATGRVSKLDVAGWGFKGRLAPELAGLDHLQSLTLENNDFTGGLSSTWGAPGVFQNLVEMDLSGNWNLSGILLSQWGAPGAFPLLQRLNLSNTGLSGELPALLGANGSLPALTLLDLSRNGISGSLPVAWAIPGALASLETLIVSANNFSGSLPTEWGINPAVFSALKTLDVRQNGLAGYLPDAWGAGFQNVSVLDLQQNLFEGQLPMDWAEAGRWPSLTSLELWNNSLTGSIPASWSNVTAIPALKTLAIKPGNAQLCGAVPLRLAKITGLQSTFLGNCTGLPARPQRALAPAPAPAAMLTRLPGALPANISAPVLAPSALVAPASSVLAPKAMIAPQPAALLPAANATAPAITSVAVLPAVVATAPVSAPAIAPLPVKAAAAVGKAAAPALMQPTATRNSSLPVTAVPASVTAPAPAPANATAPAAVVPTVPVPAPAAVPAAVVPAVPVPAPAAVLAAAAPNATAGPPVVAHAVPAIGSVLQLPAAQQLPAQAPVAANATAPAPAPAAKQPVIFPVTAASSSAPSALAAAPVPAPNAAPTSPPMGAGQAAMAAAGSSLNIGLPSPPPPFPTSPPTPSPTPVPTPQSTLVPTPQATPADAPQSTSAPTPQATPHSTPAAAAAPAGPPALFIPPSNSDGTTSYLQAAYNLTGADLSPNNSTTRKRIQTALQKALGANINATLLTVSAAKGAADASPSPSDASSSLHLTPADGSIAGAGRRLLAPQNSDGAMVAGVGNTDLTADSSASAASASGTGADTGSSPADAGAADPASSGGTSPAERDGQASWATSADAAGPSPPAQRRHNATVAAYFLITTSPDQMSAVARNISMVATANKFDQQLRLAGLPNTRARFSRVSQILPDGTLKAVSGAAAAASPAAGPMASASPAPMITPAADTSGFLTGSQSVASASPSPPASSGPNTGAIAGGIVGAVAAVIIAVLAGLYVMRLRRGRQQGSGKALAKGNDAGGAHMEAGKGGTGYVGPKPTAQPDQDKVAAMIASMKADAARAVSQRQPSAKSEGFAGVKTAGGKKGSTAAASAAVAGAGAGKLAEDSAHERDDNSESTVSEDSINRLGQRQRSGSIEEIRHRGDSRTEAEQQRYLDKGKGKMIERRRTDSASSLRSVLRGSNGSAAAEVAGPSSSSEGGSGSTPGSAPESLSGSEGMAPIKTVSRMAPHGSGSAGEQYMRANGSGGRGQSGTPPQRSRPGLSGPHHSGPARAPLSPYSTGRGQHSSSRSRSGNILAHLAAELEKAEASGGVDRLMGNQGSRGGTYPGASSGRSRRTSDPDLLSALGYSSTREQSGRALTAGEYAAVLAARDRQRSGQSRGGSRNSSASREIMRSDGAAPLQDLVRSISGHREGHSQTQEQLLRTLEQRLGLRGPSGGHQGSSQLRSSSSGRSRSSNLERTGSAGSDQRLYRGSRSDGIDRVNSHGSNISGLGGPMESVGEDQEMKGSDWASAMRILSDMEHDQHHDSRDCDRRRPREDAPMSSGRRHGGSSH